MPSKLVASLRCWASFAQIGRQRDNRLSSGGRKADWSWLYGRISERGFWTRRGSKSGVPWTTADDPLRQTKTVALAHAFSFFTKNARFLPKLQAVSMPSRSLATSPLSRPKAMFQ